MPSVLFTFWPNITSEWNQYLAFTPRADVIFYVFVFWSSKTYHSFVAWLKKSWLGFQPALMWAVFFFYSWHKCNGVREDHLMHTVTDLYSIKPFHSENKVAVFALSWIERTLHNFIFFLLPPFFYFISSLFVLASHIWEENKIECIY